MHLRLRPLDRVLGTAEGCPPRFVVNLQPGRPRVAVSGLADRAGIEQMPGAAELHGRPGWSNVALCSRLEPESNVAVADENQRLARGEEAPVGGLGAEHVVPDGVAGAGVEELRSR